MESSLEDIAKHMRVFSSCTREDSQGRSDSISSSNPGAAFEPHEQQGPAKAGAALQMTVHFPSNPSHYHGGPRSLPNSMYLSCQF